MKKNKTDAKGILATIRGLFKTDATGSAAEPVEAQKGAFMGATAAYNVTGAAPVYVDISDDNLPGIEQGDNVFADATETTPYPDGTYTVDGSQFSFTVVAGVVSLIVDATGAGPGAPTQQAPAAAPAQQQQQPAPAPAMPPVMQPAQQQQPVMQPRFASTLPASFEAFKAAFGSDKEDSVKVSPEEAYTAMLAMVGKFATGTVDERLGAVETMVKALMQYAYGYEIQRIDQQTAISTYKNSVETLQTQMSKQDKQIVAYKEAGEKLTGLFEEFLEIPETAPVTLNEKDKTRFEKEEKKEKHIQNIAAALKDFKKK